MKVLKYKTRGNSDPSGKAKVFICCHPVDRDVWLDTISKEILEKANCAVYYTEEGEGAEDSLDLALQQMNLFVVPVTQRFLTEEDEESGTQLELAEASNIPILPLICEPGLDALFSRRFGDLQYLDKFSSESTAIPYDEKLENFLSAVIFGDELAEKVRSAFDAYIFLSYRKKDREYAQNLMKLIHENEFARDVAVWYDEFLTPGEDFNDLISAALEKSSLFVLTVTPNVVNEINYIMNIEYPMAVEQGKPIAPVEMVETDGEALKQKYQGIPDPVSAYDSSALAQLLKEKLSSVKISASEDPNHLFFIGLAYLSGIDVEKNSGRALELLKRAADGGLDEAYEKLRDIYYYGDGVETDYKEALKWEKALGDRYGNAAEKTRTDAELYELLKLRMRYGRLAYEAKQYKEAEWAFEVSFEAARMLCFTSASDNPLKKIFGFAKKIAGRGEYFGEGMYFMTVCARYMLDIYSAMGMTDAASEWGRKAINTGNAANAALDDPRIDRERMYIFDKMGDICLESGNLPGAEQYYENCDALVPEGKEKDARLAGVDSFCNYSRLERTKGDLQKAKEYGYTAYTRCRDLYEEFRDYSLLEKTIDILMDLTEMYDEDKDLDSAADALDEAMALVDAAAERGENLLLERLRSRIYFHRGSVLTGMFRYDMAMEQMQKGLDMVNRMAENNADRSSTEEVIYAYTKLGECCRASGDLKSAMEWYEKTAGFISDTVAFTRSVSDSRRAAEVNRILFDVYLQTNNGALARKQYELTDFYLDALARSTKLSSDRAAHEAFKKRLHEAKNAPSTPEKQGDLLSWIAKNDKTLEEDHPDYLAYLEKELGPLCREFSDSHRDFEGRRPISDFGQLLRLDAVLYREMSEEKRQSEKWMLCGKITQSLIKNYHPFLKFEETANLLLAYCGLYEIIGSKHVFSKGGKEQTYKDYGRFYYGIPFWYYPLERIEHKELWRVIYHYATPYLK
jgi:TPR repeat protein